MWFGLYIHLLKGSRTKQSCLMPAWQFYFAMNCQWEAGMQLLAWKWSQVHVMMVQER